MRIRTELGENTNSPKIFKNLSPLPRADTWVRPFVYIAARGLGKYFGARLGASAMKMAPPVRKYLGLTLLPHSGVSLVFTGIACTSLAARPELAQIVQGTIAAAAVINEIIAVIAAKKGFELAGEIPGSRKKAKKQAK